MGRVNLELYRQFLTDGAYIESPIGSGYYTLGLSTESPGGSGLYTTGGLPETPGGSGLYDIPESGRMLRTTNLENYSIQEDATTIDPSNYFGGAGQITVGINEGVDTKEFMTASLTLEDVGIGATHGTVRSMTGQNYSISVVGDSLMGLLNTDKVAVPQANRTLRQAMEYYFGLVDLGGQVNVASSVANRNVRYPGFAGNLFDHLKQIMVAEQLEMAVVGSVVSVRPLRTNELKSSQYVETGWSLNTQNTARKVRIHYYANLYAAQGEVYPVPETPVMRPDRENAPEPAEPQIYSVDAGETLIVNVQLKASLQSVNQPTCVDFVHNQSYAGTTGVYAVAGSDGKPVTAAQWRAQGGRLSVRLLEGGSELEVKIIGASNSALAPYRIAMTAGTGAYYNSLHITGAGIFQTDRYVDLITGSTATTTGEEIGAEVTNPYIDNISKAYRVGSRTAANYAMEYTTSGSGPRLLGGRNDSFGNVAAARLLGNNAYFRVNTATLTPDTMTVDASLDTLIKDMNDKFNGMTMGEMSEIWEGRTMLDFSVAPLKGENS